MVRFFQNRTATESDGAFRQYGRSNILETGEITNGTELIGRPVPGGKPGVPLKIPLKFKMEISKKKMIHLICNRNFRIFRASGKRALAGFSIEVVLKLPIQN